MDDFAEYLTSLGVDFKSLPTGPDDIFSSIRSIHTDVGRFADEREARDVFCSKFSWAIPTEEAINRIVKCGPVVEIGAGTGFWAHLITESGGDVVAYDLHPVKNGLNRYHRRKEPTTYFTVRFGDPGRVEKHQDRALFLCWPPYSTDMAADSLRLYKGDCLILVGEDEGCTAKEKFFNRLHREWDIVDTVTLPQWIGLHDYMTIWKRIK